VAQPALFEIARRTMIGRPPERVLEIV